MGQLTDQAPGGINSWRAVEYPEPNQRRRRRIASREVLPMNRVSYAGHVELPRDEVAWTDASCRYSKTGWKSSTNAGGGTRRLSFEPRGGYHLPYRAAEAAKVPAAKTSPRKHLRDRGSQDSLKKEAEAIDSWDGKPVHQDVTPVQKFIKTVKSQARQEAMDEIQCDIPADSGYASLRGYPSCEGLNTMDAAIVDAAHETVRKENGARQTRPVSDGAPRRASGLEAKPQKTATRESSPSKQMAESQRPDEQYGKEFAAAVIAKVKSNLTAGPMEVSLPERRARSLKERSTRTASAKDATARNRHSFPAALRPEEMGTKLWEARNTPSPSNSSTSGIGGHGPKILRRVKGNSDLRPVKPNANESDAEIVVRDNGGRRPATDVSALKLAQDTTAHIPNRKHDSATQPVSQSSSPDVPTILGPKSKAPTPMVLRLKPRPFPDIKPPRHGQKRVAPRRMSDISECMATSEDSDGNFSVESDFYSVPNSSGDFTPLQPDDPFAPQIAGAVDEILRQWQAQQRGGTNTGSKAPRRYSSNAGSPSQARKRSQSTQGGSDSLSPDDEPNALVGSKRAKTSNQPVRMLACPFWKKNPDNHRHCYKKVLSRIKYVKSHLYRFHEAPAFCPCCGRTFQDEPTRDQHLRARQCQVVDSPFVHSDGLSRTQRLEVQKRADPRMSEEEQWFTIWDILFPTHRRPQSAYIDNELSEDLCNFREFFTSSGTTILLDFLNTADPMYARSQQRTVYERVVLEGAMERIYEQWATERGLRLETASTSVPSQATDESVIASRDSLNIDGLMDQGLTPNTSDDVLSLPASTVRFATQGNEDFTPLVGDDAYFEIDHQHLLEDDLSDFFNVDIPGQLPGSRSSSSQDRA